MERGLAIAVILLAGSGCVPLPAAMRKAGPTLAPGNPQLAQVVFARPLSFIAGSETVYVLERRTQRVVGVTVNESAFAVELEPGIYELCPAPNIENPAWQSVLPFDLTQVLRTPLTRIEVAAGRRYLIEVIVDRAVYEFVPARPGSLREKRLKEAFPTLQLLAPNEASADLNVSPVELAPWFENCLDSSPERRLLAPEEGESLLPVEASP